jgi:hypothetical protein
MGRVVRLSSAPMQIQHAPFINAQATYDNAKPFGTQTVILTLQVKGKPATITMNRAEAEQMAAGLATALKPK